MKRRREKKNGSKGEKRVVLAGNSRSYGATRLKKFSNCTASYHGGRVPDDLPRRAPARLCCEQWRVSSSVVRHPIGQTVKALVENLMATSRQTSVDRFDETCRCVHPSC